MADENLKKLKALVWRHTHRDFKGKVDGAKTVLHFVPGTGTSIVLLDSLTREELLDKLPKSVRTAYLEEHS